jgi:hypothetical protein
MQEQNGGLELNQIGPQPQSYQIYTPRWMTEYLINWVYCDTMRVYVPAERKVHGLGSLPRGYKLAYVPRDALVAFKWDEDPPTPDDSNSPIWRLSFMLEKIRNFAGEAVVAVKSWFHSLINNEPKAQETNGVIASSYALPKALIALFQLVYGALSLTNSRGDQINKFGYASFGLTVAVYTVMAFINLVGHLLTPDYSALFLVQNEVLDEILDCPDHNKNFADGVVGRLIPADGQYRNSNFQPRRLFNGAFTDPVNFQMEQTIDGLPAQMWTLFPPGRSNVRGNPVVQIPACPLFKRKLQLYDVNPSPSSARNIWFGRLRPAPGADRPALRPRLKRFNGVAVYGTSVFFVGLICFTIIATFSKLQNRESTQAQRGWTMSWFISGMIAGYFIPLGHASEFGIESPVRYEFMDIDNLEEENVGLSDNLGIWGRLLPLTWIAPTVGGFVVVAQMINNYGNCVKLD